MKFKLDYVTNSSSTNFILMCKREINSAEDLIDAFGLMKNSPIYNYVYDFCNELFLYFNGRYFDFKDEQDIISFIEKEFGSETLKKYKKLTKKGYYTYISKASTDFNEIMTFFAMDYFELDRKGFYINGKQNVF